MTRNFGMNLFLKKLFNIASHNIGKIAASLLPLKNDTQSFFRQSSQRRGALKSMFRDNSICLKSAFTLAEILITLAIIGIVASMTIPTMMQKIQIEQFRVALKKEYSTLTQAINMIQAQNSSLDVSTVDNLVNELATQMAIVKQGTYASITKMPANFGYKCYKATGGTCGSLITRPGMNGWKTFITKNGTLFLFLWGTSPDCSRGNNHAKIIASETLPQFNECAEILVDLNGEKTPNQIGVDMQWLYLLKKNNNYYIKPSGSNWNTNCSAATPNDYNLSLHCTNRMLLDMPMP